MVQKGLTPLELNLISGLASYARAHVAAKDK